MTCSRLFSLALKVFQTLVHKSEKNAHRFFFVHLQAVLNSFIHFLKSFSVPLYNEVVSLDSFSAYVSVDV